jgi:MYXO-CTERM domain-containing protein
MATNRGTQRGVIQAVSTVILAAFAALLSMTGCSSNADPEALDSSEAAIGICPRCPIGTACRSWGCSAATNYKCVSQDAPDLTDCADAVGPGVCTAGICCRTCYHIAKGPVYSCAPAIDAANCGLPGGKCTAVCNSNDACVHDFCTANGTCGNDKIPEGKPCEPPAMGDCHNGSCCAGCLDKNGTCQPGTQPSACGFSDANGLVDCQSCVDANPCTTDTCDPKGACTNPPVADDTSCADANKCNGDETCQGGSCKSPANFMCPADNNPCHAPSCDPQTGCGQQNLNNVACADGDKCNGTEMCVTGVCTAGTPLDCDDNNPCTDDTCDPMGGCAHTAVMAGTQCDDGDVCNGISTCVGKVCTAGKPLSCDDNNVCTDESCDKVQGCIYTTNTADCSDNNVCTIGDKCANGTCKGGAAPNCDDNEACTTDSCDPIKGCQHAAVADGGNCDDGNDCSTGDKCVAGKCKASGGLPCDDSNACTQNTCDPVKSVCAYPKENDGTPCTFDRCHVNSTCQTGACSQGDPIDCDDANPCTTDSCDPLTGCKHVADNAAKCSDGDVCTNADHCKSSVCIGTDVVCAPLDECHEPGTCNAQSGVCDDPRSEDNKPCKGGHCDTGKCVPDPIGAGGAGGETGAGGDGTAGSLAQGGEPPVMGNGGQGNEVAVGGEPGGPGETGGKGGKSSSGGSTSSQEGGEPPLPDHVFVRDPGGCACSVPDQRGSSDLAWLAALGMAALIAGGRRRGRSATKTRILG